MAAILQSCMKVNYVPLDCFVVKPVKQFCSVCVCCLSHVDLTLVILRVFPKHIFLREVVATPLDYQY